MFQNKTKENIPSLHRRTLEEIIGTLPEIRPLRPSLLSSESHMGCTSDLFICALGFEPRCLSIPEALQSAGYKAVKSLCFEYSTNREDNDLNRVALHTHLMQITKDGISYMEADEQPFCGRLRELLQSLSAQQSGLPVVFLDISVMSDRVLLRVLKVLMEFEVKLQILYAEAEVYYPTQSQYQSDPARWCDDEALTLEEGISAVTPSEEHPGFHIDPAPDCVIIFPSFKKDRARGVIIHVDPSLLASPEQSIVWLLGLPRLPQDHWRLDAMRAINGLNEKPFSASLQKEVSTFDYRETLQKLDAIYEERRGLYRFTLSMMGAKMQAIGTALFCYLHPDVKIVFVTPQRYNASQYSMGCKTLWSLEFEDTKALQEALDSVGKLRVEYRSLSDSSI